jgi:repressor LexA
VTDIASNRIRELRKAAGMTMEQLGALIGVHFTTIAKIERSQRRVSGELLHAIATALGVEPSELVDDVPTTLPVRMVPIVGTIAAGNWREAVAEPIGHIPVPIQSSKAFALRPEGDSMAKVVGENAIIVVDPEQVELHDGKLYAVMNSEGETTFKRFRLDPPRLEPLSWNPVHKPIPLGREPFTVVGRIVWQGSQL